MRPVQMALPARSVAHEEPATYEPEPKAPGTDELLIANDVLEDGEPSRAARGVVLGVILGGILWGVVLWSLSYII